MKKINFKNRLLALVVCVFAWIGARAQTVETITENGQTIVVVTTTAVGQMGNLQGNQDIQGASYLRLIGPFNSDDFTKFGGCNPTTLDLTDAIIPQGTPSYTYYYVVEKEEANGQTVRNKYVIHDGGIYILGGQVNAGSESNAQEQFVGSATSQNIANLGIDINDQSHIYTASVSDGVRLPSWSNLTTLYLPEDENYTVVGYQFANSLTNLTNLTIPDNIKVIGNQAFYKTGLQQVDLNKVEVFCDQAFEQSALTSVTLPYTTTYVGYHAFENCTSLTKVVFDADPDKNKDQNRHIMVKNRAFFNSAGITDVYINTLAKADCENGAFNYYVTWGHGATDHGLASLHFSPEVASHYANLSHPLTNDVARDAAKFHNWLLEHYKQAGSAGGNGWWEFVSNGTIEEKGVTGSKFLRTFSDYNCDRIVPAGVKAYIVTGLTTNDKGEYVVNLQQLFVIPKRTGVILYGVSNSKDQNDNPILSMSLCEIANGYPLRRDYWNALQGDNTMKNYLWPTCVALDPNGYKEENYAIYTFDSNGGYTVDFTHTRKVLKEATGNSAVAPYGEKTGFVTPTPAMNGCDATLLNGFFRNFYMSRYSSTTSGKEYKRTNGNMIESDFVGFFRAKKNSSIKPGMAYLLLKADEFSNAEGGEVVINPDTKSPFVYKDTYGNSSEYTMKAYQVEYSKQDGKPIYPSTSGYWVEVEEGQTEPVPYMKWDLDANWGDRKKVTEKPTPPIGTNGAKFIAVTFSGEPEIIEHGDGIATMIVPSNMIEPVETGEYYNLQGVRVTNPTKGVYIVNGKKVVIK